MTNVEKEPGTPLPLGQLVKMIAPIFMFGVILPFVDMVTDLRMIIRLYAGLQGCSVNANFTCFESANSDIYCQENPEECSTEQHPIFASILLGKLNMGIWQWQSIWRTRTIPWACPDINPRSSL